MQDVTDGNINCVIVKDLSRLGREYIETGRYLRRVFPAYGVRFIAITDSMAARNDRIYPHKREIQRRRRPQQDLHQRLPVKEGHDQ